MMELGLDKEMPFSFSDYLIEMLGMPRIKLDNLRMSQRLPCLSLSQLLITLVSLQFTGYYFNSVHEIHAI